MIGKTRRNMNKVRHVRDLPEESHPFLKGVTMKTLLSRQRNGADSTCIVVRCPVGSEIEEHIHPMQDDLIYVLEGEATIWIEGSGEYSLTAGAFVAVSRGKRHKTYNVKRDLLIYDVFTPPIF
jgi:quercetin dioxygenase-like cupin family protein